MRHGTRIPLFLIVAIACCHLLCYNTAYSQFSGSVSAGINNSSNVTGTDTAAADNIFTPAITIQYIIPFCDPFSITFGASATSNLYTESPDRSYEVYNLTGKGEYYFLSPLPKKPKEDSQQQVQQSTNKAAVKQQQVSAAPDSIATLAIRLSNMSDALDSVDIDTLGIDEDSIDAASDLKDSLSESILAISQILTTESFTESIQEVLLEEIQADLLLIKQIPLQQTIKDQTLATLQQTKHQLQKSPAPSDIVSLNPPPTETTSLPQKITEELHITVLKEDAPLFTIVNPETEITAFSSLDVSLKDDIAPRTAKTLATSISLPLSYEAQVNRDSYSVFSYSQYYLRPQLQFYPSSEMSVGTQYEFSQTAYPNDTLFTYSQHALCLDSRLELNSWLVLGAQVSFKNRTYKYPPIDSVIRIPRAGLVPVYDDGTFTRTEFGITTTAIASDVLTVGIGGAFSRASELRPYFHDLQLRSVIGGPAADDEFSYELSKLFIYSSSRLVWDITAAVDLSFEYRKYGRGTMLTKQAQRFDDRNDHALSAQLDFSYDIFFNERLFSLFETITPELNLQYSKFNSSIKQYRYHDLAALFTLSAGF